MIYNTEMARAYHAAERAQSNGSKGLHIRNKCRFSCPGCSRLVAASDADVSCLTDAHDDCLMDTCVSCLTIAGASCLICTGVGCLMDAGISCQCF